MAKREWVGRNLDWLVAVAPGAVGLVVGAISPGVSALFGQGVLEALLIGLLLCVVAGVAAPFVVLALRRRNSLTWFIVSPCVSVLGLYFGFLLWLAALSAVCDNCFS
jgi:hypothetical protein